MHNILAATYANLNQFDASIECSNHALQIDPENIKALKNLGGALKHIGDLTSAIECYHNALQIEPGNADLHNNLGTALKETEDIGTAEKSFQAALEIDPDNVANITSLCDFYDKTNDLSGLACTISKSKNNSTLNNSNFLYYCAMLHFRQKEYAIAKTYIDQIKPDELIPKGANVFYGLKGKILDKIGMYDDAFSAFSHMNKQVADSDLCKQINPDKYFNSISSSLKKFKEAPNYLHSTNSIKIDLVNTPCFLIGFPRSGTTLLDTILRSHSKITRLLRFLGLEWETAITNYQKTALERGTINTPSYNQVVQPLYKDALYRWKNYDKYFQPYTDQIQPWIERFGYA